MHKNILIFGLFFALATSLSAQDSTSRWGIVLNGFHQEFGLNIDVGSLQTTNPVLIRPGFSAGIERTWLEGKRGRGRLYQDLHIGNWYSPYSENYAFIGTKVGVDIKVFKQLRFSPALSYRAGMAKPKDIRYIYENDRWVPSGNLSPAFLKQMVGLNLQLSYRFLRTTSHPIDFHFGANYQYTWKFLPVAYSNPFFYRALEVGVRYSL
jgi:hypothetical protein